MKKSLIILHLCFTFSLSFSQKYIFYLHGKIVENQGEKAVDKVNGYRAYLYTAILDSLKQKNNRVISEVRAKDTNVKEYALKVKKQIDSLLKTGIAPKNITVIGASKGSTIAMYVSTYVKNSSVNYVFLAACSHELSEDEKDMNCYGNILSIYEKSDGAGSCTALKKHSNGIIHYKEVEINTGLRHGFLYKPLAEWLVPALRWANNDYN